MEELLQAPVGISWTQDPVLSAFSRSKMPRSKVVPNLGNLQHVLPISVGPASNGGAAHVQGVYNSLQSIESSNS